MHVTAVSNGQIAIGGILTSANGYSGHVIDQDSGTPGGVGFYDVWYGALGYRIIVPPGTALSETCTLTSALAIQAQWPSARRSRATV